MFQQPLAQWDLFLLSKSLAHTLVLLAQPSYCLKNRPKHVLTINNLTEQETEVKLHYSPEKAFIRVGLLTVITAMPDSCFWRSIDPPGNNWSFFRISSSWVSLAIQQNACFRLKKHPKICCLFWSERRPTLQKAILLSVKKTDEKNSLQDLSEERKSLFC